MTLSRLLSISAGLLFPFLLSAEADGPDYWKIQSNDAVNLVSDKASSEPILSIPSGTDGLINKGCDGLQGFDEWSNMTDEEREDVKQNVWCRVIYADIKGWIPKIHLIEGHPPSPSYDCSKASGQVENLICEDVMLMHLDREIDHTFKAAVARVKNLDADSEIELKRLKAYQRGWIKGRNDCWKVEDMASCVKQSYQERISKLQAQWMLLPAENTVSYFCTDNSEVFITYYASLLPSVSVERGDQRQIYVSDGANKNYYEGDFGRSFEINNNHLNILFNTSSAPLVCTLN